MSLLNKIYSGDKVRCLCNIENSHGEEFEVKNKLGTIKIKENGEYGIEFDDFINGHALVDKRGISHCETGYGLWLKKFHFIKVNKEEYKKSNKNTYIKGEDEKMNNGVTEKMELMVETISNLLKEVKAESVNKEKAKIYFAKLYEDVIIPSKEDENAGFDIYAHFDQEEFNFKPHETKLIPTGLLSACSQEYVLIGKERGSTGSIGMKCGAGIIDSGYRNEIFVAITNDNNIPLIISKNVNKTIKNEAFIIYPYSKAIAQLLLVPVPSSEVEEITVEQLKAIPSKRGVGCLGSSGK